MVFLPDEILANIFSHFEARLPPDQWHMYGAQLDRSPYKTLTSLCLVSRQFHRVAQPFLYHTIILEDDDEDEDQFDRFTRTLVSKPSMGTSVHTVTLETGFRELSQPELLKGVLKEKLDLPESIKERFDEEMDGIRIYRREDDRLSAALLAFMPNLQLFEQTLHGNSELLAHMLSGRVDLDEPLDDSPSPTHANTGPGSMVKFANFGLPHLTEVRLRTGDCQDNSTPIGDVEEILLHPRLQTLRLQGFAWLAPELHDLKYSGCRNHNLEFLELKECLVDVGTLRHIFNHFKNLRRLKIELGDARRTLGRDDEDGWRVDLDQFGDVLRKYGTDLVEFDLQTAEFDWPDSFIGSLRELKSLRHLRVAQEDFVDRWYELWDGHPPPMSLADALPPSIETLFLYNQLSWHRKETDEERWQEMYDLITSGRFPKLRSIEVELILNSPAARSKRLEEKVDGWDIHIDQRLMWERYSSTGCMRTIVVFSKLER